MSDHFSDYDEQTTSSTYNNQTASDNPHSDDKTTGAYVGANSQGSYSQEVFSEKISARYRTFFIDVKENANGHLVKVSEKSRGKKSTIMFDAEDLEAMITALQNAKNAIDA